jgi:hypothetical protein
VTICRDLAENWAIENEMLHPGAISPQPYTTVNSSLDIKRGFPPEEVEWLFIRITITGIVRGYSMSIAR